MSHTPGPWKFKRAKFPVDGSLDFGISALIEGKPYCISEAFGRCDRNIELPAEENARLIAAAPDMLAVLETISKMPDAPSDLVGHAQFENARALAFNMLATIHRQETAPASALGEPK